MSQSSELEEGEHPTPIKLKVPPVIDVESQESSPEKVSEDENNHIHKLYTRGVGALLGGIIDSEPMSLEDCYKPDEQARIPLPELKPLSEMR